MTEKRTQLRRKANSNREAARAATNTVCQTGNNNICGNNNNVVIVEALPCTAGYNDTIYKTLIEQLQAKDRQIERLLNMIENLTGKLYTKTIRHEDQQEQGGNPKG